MTNQRHAGLLRSGPMPSSSRSLSVPRFPFFFFHSYSGSAKTLCHPKEAGGASAGVRTWTAICASTASPKPSGTTCAGSGFRCPVMMDRQGIG